MIAGIVFVGETTGVLLFDMKSYYTNHKILHMYLKKEAEGNINDNIVDVVWIFLNVVIYIILEQVIISNSRITLEQLTLNHRPLLEQESFAQIPIGICWHTYKSISPGERGKRRPIGAELSSGHAHLKKTVVHL